MTKHIKNMRSPIKWQFVVGFMVKNVKIKAVVAAVDFVRHIINWSCNITASQYKD